MEVHSTQLPYGKQKIFLTSWFLGFPFLFGFTAISTAFVINKTDN